MISNITKLERLAQAVFRYVSIKKAFFSFFYNSYKVLFLEAFRTFGQSVGIQISDLPIDTYRQTGKKRTAPIDAVLLPEKEDKIIGCLPCPYIPLSCI